MKILLMKLRLIFFAVVLLGNSGNILATQLQMADEKKTSLTRYRLAGEGDALPLPFSLTGFSDPEKGHRWTNAKQATIKIPVNQDQGQIKTITFKDAHALISGSYEQKLSIAIKGQLGKEYIFNTRSPSHTIELQFPSNLTDLAEIVLDMPNACCPGKLYPENLDPRELAIVLNLVDLTFFQPLRPLETVLYRLAGEGDALPLPFSLTGFSDPEKGHRWTNAKQATIKIPVNQDQGQIKTITFKDAHALISGSYEQKLSIAIKGQLGKEYIFNTRSPSHTIELQFPSNLTDLAEIVLDMPNACCPGKLYPENRDPRELAIVLNLVELSYLMPSSSLDKPRELPKQNSECVLSISEEFPGHKSRILRETIEAPDNFNPAHHEQNKCKGEAACDFLSVFAGFMHTEYGRTMFKSMIAFQTDTEIGFYFYLPDSHVFPQYFNPEHRYKIRNQDRMIVSVPKKFAFREDKGSFPQSHPACFNLFQQAYMYSFISLFQTANETDVFTFIRSRWYFAKVSMPLAPENYTNIITETSDQTLHFCSFIDIPMKEVKILIKNDGLDLQAIKDFKAMKNMADPSCPFSYTPMVYHNVAEFAHAHGLSKDLLLNSNVIQFNSKYHSVALFFGQGRVHYYDNVYYPPQVSVYGVNGPMYEEARHFKGQDLNAMTEVDFFTRLFKEISARLGQVTAIRGEATASEAPIFFFIRPLVDNNLAQRREVGGY